MLIPIDFVAGSHGNFLEVVLNSLFGFVDDQCNPFNELGASHTKSQDYFQQRRFVARHWFETAHSLNQYPRAISIQFDQDDLLVLSSVSLFRAGDLGIDNNLLEIDTVKKLRNQYYESLLEEILQAYPFLDPGITDVPRNILREFFKYGFRNPNSNGYWKKQQSMQYTQPVFVFKFKNFYDVARFKGTVVSLSEFLELPVKMHDNLDLLHEKFLLLNPYVAHKEQCDKIIQSVITDIHADIPSLTLLQESYINAELENIYQKEMPFHDSKYFTSTKDVLYYINNQAPNL
jgi:hypothetical protein